MRKSVATLLLLSAVVVTASCDDVHARGSRRRSGAEKSLTFNKSWPATDIERLCVVEVDGTITVEAADTNEISLVAVATGDLQLKPEKENQGLFETSIDGDTLRIGRQQAKKKKFHFMWDEDDLRIEYALKVPRGMELDVNTVNGRITTRGIEGETEATSVNGTIDVEVSGENELAATTVNGRVKARFFKDFTGAKFRTVNGGVEATLPQSASFNVDLAQVNGDFEAAFPLSVHSNPGRRRVSGEVNGGQHALKIITVNGDVELTKLGEQK